MLISLNWIRDFVPLPEGLDPRELAERFTRTTAEVEGVEPIRIDAKGLIVARVERVMELPETRGLRLVVLNTGSADPIETVTAAPNLRVGANVVYAPVGASLGSLGAVGSTKVAGRMSAGLIVPGEAIGISMLEQEAVLASNSMRPGQTIPSDWFDDWVIEVDNKSITHRPDLWGHYGIAREIAAILQRKLQPYPVTPLEELGSVKLPDVPIVIADPEACSRYSGIILGGVAAQPSPLCMQLRLAHVGMRPINALVDLTNYCMAELGQPMHAFDAAKVDRIEVGWAKEGNRFTTLDGVERTLRSTMLMIQCRGRAVGLAGVMGGRDSEVCDSTTSLLLESANFDAATIRKTAVALGLRTDASARFEKSLDPTNTALAIQRFLYLAKPEFPALKLMSRLSDCYPRPRAPVSVTVDSKHVMRAVGRDVPPAEIGALLTPLGFVVDGEDAKFQVTVPSFRAGDISIEADVIEEIARCVGYGTIDPAMPLVSMRRFEPHALHELEQQTLGYFTSAHGFHEVHGYIWYDENWLGRLGVDAGTCIELRNPAAEGYHRLRRSLVPGLLAAVVKNRFHFAAFSLIEVGSVFEPRAKAQAEAGRHPDLHRDTKARRDAYRDFEEAASLGEHPIWHVEDNEYRHVGLVVAQRGKHLDDAVYTELKSAVELWAWERLTRTIAFANAHADPVRRWEDRHRTASIVIEGMAVGRLSLVDLPLRRAMDEHLAAWAVGWAEMRLSGQESAPPPAESLGRIPNFPLVEMDFSLLVPKSVTYATVVDQLRGFRHDKIRSVRYVGAYEGDRIDADKRSLTFRAVIGDDMRTLNDADSAEFRQRFEAHIRGCGYALRH